MCYIASKEVLPIEILELIQNYVECEYIYITKRELKYNNIFGCFEIKNVKVKYRRNLF